MLETQLEDLCEFYQVRVGFLWDLEKTLMRFQLVTHFYTPWKHQKTRVFLFSGGIEMEQGMIIG